MRILVASLGSIGRRHLANIRAAEPQAEILVLRHTRSDEGPPPGADGVVYSLDEAVGWSPEVAFICAPTAMHARVGIALADAGAHLFVEKPIAATTADAAALVEATTRAGRVLLVGYNLRFLPSLRALHRELQSGSIGRPMSMRAEVGQYLPDWRPGADYRNTNTARPELGAGIEFELSHEIDYARWLLGDVESVFGTFARTSDLEIEGDDTAEIVLRFRSGALGSIHMDMTQRVATRSCRVAATEGTLTWDGIAGTVRRFRVHEGWTTIHDGDGDRNEMYVAETQHMFACVRGEQTPVCGGIDGTQVVQIAEATRKSAGSGMRILL